MCIPDAVVTGLLISPTDNPKAFVDNVMTSYEIAHVSVYSEENVCVGHSLDLECCVGLGLHCLATPVVAKQF